LNISNDSANNNKYHIPNSFSILIVDDEIDILSVIKRRLEEYGFNICSFTKASIALEHYKPNTTIHRLIISDFQMPNMNGFEFIREVKKIDSTVKVFLMTCFETNDLDSLLSLSTNSSSPTKLVINEFIQKPFSIEELIILINKHMMNRAKDRIAMT
jgi:DNA-binding NtrC family response regulator